MTGLLQLNPWIPVHTPLGDGDAMFLIDYHHEVNTVWVVRFPGGVVKHVYSDDVRVYGNPMNGRGWDVEELPGANISDPDAARALRETANRAAADGRVGPMATGWYRDLERFYAGDNSAHRVAQPNSGSRARPDGLDGSDALR